MMKRLLIVSLFVLLLAQVGWAQGVCHRQTEPVGGFSFCPPAGWSSIQKEGEKYNIVYGPRGDLFTPNINFKDEENTAALADYVAASVKYIQDNYAKIEATSIKLVSQTNFITTSRIAGIRVVFRTEYKGLVVRTVQYYFNRKNGNKFIATCTSLEAEAGALDPAFDLALKSFQFDQ